MPVQPKTIRNYVTTSGKEPFEDWLQALIAADDTPGGHPPEAAIPRPARLSLWLTGSSGLVRPALRYRPGRRRPAGQELLGSLAGGRRPLCRLCCRLDRN